MGAHGTQGSGATSFADRVVDRLNTWPAVRVVRADCGMGVGLAANARQIMHLHSADEAELRLTRPVIGRLGAALTGSGRVAVQPGGDWVRIQLSTESDVTFVITLVSVAIKAADTTAEGSAPCGAARRGALRRWAARR